MPVTRKRIRWWSPKSTVYHKNILITTETQTAIKILKWWETRLYQCCSFERVSSSLSLVGHTIVVFFLIFLSWIGWMKGKNMHIFSSSILHSSRAILRQMKKRSFCLFDGTKKRWCSDSIRTRKERATFFRAAMHRKKCQSSYDEYWAICSIDWYLLLD